MRWKVIRFIYATKEDLLRLDAEMKPFCDYSFVSQELVNEQGKTPTEWASIADIPELGINNGDQMVRSTGVVVMPPNEAVCMEETAWYGPRLHRKPRYTVDTSSHAHNSLIVALPGLNTKHKAMLPGEIAFYVECMKTPIYKAFITAKRKVFRKFGDLTIGQDAVEHVRQGWRLANSLHAGKREDWPARVVLDKAGHGAGFKASAASQTSRRSTEIQSGSSTKSRTSTRRNRKPQ